MKKTEPCRILLVEDEPSDAHLVRQMLSSSAVFSSELIWANCLADAGVECDLQKPDLLLLDLSLPDSQGLETLRICRKRLGAVPIIVLTGNDDNEFALQALDHGAQDYLLKGSFDGDGLVRAIRYALSRAALEARLYESEARMNFALEGAKLGLWDWRIDTGRVVFNSIWAEMLGYTLDELAMSITTWTELVHPDDWAAIDAALQSHLAGQTAVYQSEHRMRHKDGHWVWVFDTGRVVERDGDGRALRAVGIHQDISDRKLAEARDRLLVAALDAVSLGVIITDTEARIEWANPAFAKLTGYGFDETQGRRPADLVKSGRQDAAFYQAMWQVINSGQPWHGELVNKRKNGELYYEELTIAPVPDENGAVQHFVGVKQDVSQRKRLEAELLELATTDPLTGLYNRRYFMNKLEEELSRIRRKECCRVSVLMLDLDHFKSINDRYGHAVGDQMLCHIAALMRDDVRRIDLIARLGGEEFAIVMIDSDAGAAHSFAERLRQRVELSPLSMQGENLQITVSIGVSTMKADDIGADSVLVRADQALYRSKEKGRNQVQVFEDFGGEAMSGFGRA